MKDGLWGSEFRSLSDWVQTARGRMFFPLNPHPDEVFIDDIAYALAHMPRFAGHARIPPGKWYSVAEHSWWVTQFVPAGEELEALLHDASEGCGLPDVPRPAKRSMPEYQMYEKRIEHCVAERFGLKQPMSRELFQVDTRMCLTEKKFMMAPEPAPWGLIEVLDVKKPFPIDDLHWWSPEAAEDAFLELFHRLYPR